ELSGIFKSQWRTRYDAFFAQDSWTMCRLPLQGAIRAEHAFSYYPPEYIGGTQFIPYADIAYIGSADFLDIMSPACFAFDLFMTGKTSLKVNGGKYVQQAQNDGVYTGAAPTSGIVTTATRSWQDTNGNKVVDCNLGAPGASNLSGSGGDNCGALSNAN